MVQLRLSCSTASCDILNLNTALHRLDICDTTRVQHPRFLARKFAYSRARVRKKRYLKNCTFKYRVTHKGWDCKDDLNLFNYDDHKFNYIFYLEWFIQWFEKEKISLCCRNHEKGFIISIYSVQSSLKSHHLWVTLYCSLLSS